ncbi:outer membrane beta-barrel protein [Sphingomonas sp. HF-S4]|uniref:Outer membrane beta-barrel protein n=1 Tax=Sphingomonas agrestis TaxID=3080540 RepID=A0ABU3Y981_9SPHN|nr:outer membrane beta-barrel protein [Sphingomonas sp. HF-S4]MDV3457662.1 outer membrane beta-barrel protein [Sphingomonas sp. HF-S4]
MRKSILGASGLLLFVAPSAYAQEFDGPYIGVAVGYGFEKGGTNETVRFDRGFDGTDDVVTTTAGTDAFSPGFCDGRARSTANAGCKRENGIDYHFRAGYDAQFGNFVLGVVGEAGSSSMRDSVSAFSTTPASYTLTRKIDWEAAVRVRAGYALGGTTLAYVTAGPSYAEIKNTFSTSNGQNAFLDNGDFREWGVSGGGGIEHKISSSVSVGVEYLYTRYNDDNYRVRATRGAANAINPFILFGAPGTEFRRSDDRFDFHAVRGTLSFRF